MAKQPQINQDDLREITFPYAGLSLIQPSYLKGNPGTCEIADNVVYFDPSTGGARGASRSGLRKWIPAQVSGDHEIQHIGAIVTVSGEMIDWSFDGPEQRFPGIYIGIGFIDIDFPFLRFTPITFPVIRDDGWPGSGTFSEASGYPPKKPKNEKIVARLVAEFYEMPLNTNDQLTATLRDRLGGFLSADTLTDKNFFLRTDPPGKQGDGDFGPAGGSEMTPFVQDSVRGVVYYWVEVVSVLGNVVAKSNTISIRYGPLTTTINWSNPANIDEGTALSGTQLNATASAPGFPGVPGIFTYTPPSGTILALGTHVLSVHFVPTDTATYTTPEDKTVTINVVEAGDPDIPQEDCLGVSIDTVTPPGGIAGTTVTTSAFTIAPATPHGAVLATPDPTMISWPNIVDAGTPIALYHLSGVWYYIFTP